MLSALAVSGYVIPPPALAAPVGSPATRAPTDLSARLASLSEAVAHGHAALKEQRDRFAALVEQSRELSASPEELRELASEVRTRELAVAEALRPQIERLRGNLDTRKAHADTPTIRSWRRLAEEALEITISWLELYQNLQIRLYKLASDLQSIEHPPSKVLSTREELEEHLQRLMAE